MANSNTSVNRYREATEASKSNRRDSNPFFSLYPLERDLVASRGSGSQMPPATRAKMESSFGTDFSNVRIHTDNRARQMNNELHAHAFTHGSDIYFNRGKFAPATADGTRLLAHELTHVVQQRSAPLAIQNAVQRWDPGPPPYDDSRVPETRDEKIDRFNQWHAREQRDLSWNNALPACPCELPSSPGRLYGTNVQNPDPDVWKDPTSWLWGYHSGAEWCMRSRTPTATGAGEQCCYDADARLITHGSGAGSADKVSPDHSFFGHQSEDVRPANLADELDGGRFGTFSRRYLEVRPTNNKSDCPSNS